MGTKLCPIGKSERYSLFKVGHVLCVNHGMGKPSLSILLHEITKLLERANASDVTYIRLGTCGGLSVEPGTVVITDRVFDGSLEPCFRNYVLGKEVRVFSMTLLLTCAHFRSNGQPTWMPSCSRI